MITVKEITSEKELRQFVKFPFKLYYGNPYWAPPIIKEELKLLSENHNPIFENVEAFYFVAMKNGKISGRIAAIINHVEVNKLKKSKVRFGWFDAIDDLDVTKSLLKEVEKIGKKYDLDYMEGPVGFSNFDKAGLLTEGFTEESTMATLYNFPYYENHFHQLGFSIADEWVEYKFNYTDKTSKTLDRLSKTIVKRYNVNTLTFKNTKQILPYIDEMFELINETYAPLSTYVPISKKQISFFKKKYLPFINPKFVNCVADEQGKLIAFAISMPSFTKALQYANGKLFPLGYLQILKSQYFNKKAELYLIGVKADTPVKGAISILFNEMGKSFNKFGIEEIETNPELIDNTDVQLLWKKYESKLHKRRKTFQKQLD